MRILCATIMAMALSACDGGAPQQQSSQVTEAPRAQTAEDVVNAFQAAGIKITDVRIVSEATDGNNLLGRPGQYTSKVFFYDARHPKSADRGDEGEHTVEFFNTAEDAQTRHDYIDGVTKGVPMLLQYQILHGKALARLDKIMLPSEVEEYKAVIDKMNLN